MSHFHSKTKRAWLIVAKVGVGALAVVVGGVVYFAAQIPETAYKGTGGGAATVNK